MKIKFENALVLCLDSQELLQKKEVLVEGNKIVKVAVKINDNADRIINVDGNILMSGFVNSNAKNVFSLFKGLENPNLQEWYLKHTFLEEEKLSSEDVYYGEMLGILESLKAGITCFEEKSFFIPSIIKAIEKSKVRARVGIGREKQSLGLKKDLENSLKYFSKNNQLIKPVLSPSIYTESEQDLEIYIEFAKKHNLPLSASLSETLEEVGECTIKNNNKSPVQYLEDLGFLDRECTLHHCVHMDKDDVKILADYNVNVVTCPSNNLKLASGIAPLSTFLANNVNLALGTDGPTDRIDMFKEMFLASTLQKATLYDLNIMTEKQVLQMATINGAKALGFERVGKIEEGYFADIILINIKGLHHIPQNNLISNIVYSAQNSDVYLTMVNGEILYENGEFFLEERVEDVIKNCQQIIKKF